MMLTTPPMKYADQADGFHRSECLALLELHPPSFVLEVVSSQEAEIVYDGPGEPA